MIGGRNLTPGCIVPVYIPFKTGCLSNALDTWLVGMESHPTNATEVDGLTPVSHVPMLKGL